MSQATAVAAEPAEETQRRAASKEKLLDRKLPEDEVFIHVSGNDCKVQYKEGNTTKTKMISLEDLATAMNTDLMLDTGLMAVSGRDYCGIRQYVKKGSSELIVAEMSAGERELRFQSLGVSSKVLNCPFLIGIIKFVNGRHYDSWMYTSKLPILNDQTMLYSFPFGNIFTPEQRICWGRLDTASLTPQNFLVEFIQSNFNNDLEQLYEGGGRRNFPGFLQSDQQFSYHWLRSQGTYSRIVQQKIRGM